MTEGFNGNSCIDVEKAGENEGAGSTAIEDNSDAAHNSIDYIDIEVFKLFGENTSRNEENEVLQKFLNVREVNRQDIVEYLKLFFPNNEVIELGVTQLNWRKINIFRITVDMLAYI